MLSGFTHTRSYFFLFPPTPFASIRIRHPLARSNMNLHLQAARYNVLGKLFEIRWKKQIEPRSFPINVDTPQIR